MDCLRYSFRDLQAKSSTYDSSTSENMLHAIAATSAWRESVPLLHSIWLTAKPSTSAFSVVATRAFNENEPTIGWQVLHDCLAADRIPKCEVFVAYMRMCEQLPLTGGVRMEALTRLLQFIGQHSLVVSQTVVTELGRVFEALGQTAQVVHIGDKCVSLRNCKIPC